MITPAMIYWIGILDSVKTVLYILTGLTVISAFLLWIGCFVYYMNGDNPPHAIKKGAKAATFAFLLSVTISCTTPSTRLAAAMYLVPAVVNNESVQAIGGSALEGLRLLTEDWLRDLADARKESQNSQGSSL